MEELEKLKILTGEGDESLLSLLYEDAKEFALTYTNRTEVPPALNKTIRDLTIITYNRRGTEGESSRSGAEESYSFDNAPKQIYDILDRYRLAGIGGRTYETKTKPPEAVQP